MKRICYINGSLRGLEASSLSFINDLERRFDNAVNRDFITVKAGRSTSYAEETFKKIVSADALIFVFPLYAYSLPGALMGLLEEYWKYSQVGHKYHKDTHVYVIVNCGFPVPTINQEAVRVIKNFCVRMDLKWRFAVCVSSGPVVVATKKIPFLDLKLKRAFNTIVNDVLNGNNEKINDVTIKPIIPKPIVLMIKKQFENKTKKQFQTTHKKR